MAADDDSSRNKPKSPRRACYHKRQRQSPNWIRTLRTLPREVFNACVRRLTNGDSALDVARWVFEQPNRGGCAHLSINTLRVYLSGLRHELQRVAPDGRKQLDARVHDTAQAIRREQVSADNVVAIDDAIAANRNAEEAKQQETPQPLQRAASEQKIDAIEKEVRERLLNPIIAEEFVLYDLLLNRERLLIAFRIESKVGLVLKDNTAILHADAKLIEVLAKLKDQHKADQARERWGEIVAPDPVAMQQAKAAADKLNAADYDKLLQATQIMDELIGLQVKKAEKPDEPNS